jgi:hypothetical protein
VVTHTISERCAGRIIGVNRSVIHRELMGQKDITLGRVGELASAMGRKAVIEFQELAATAGQNIEVDRPLEVRTDYSLEDHSEEQDAPDSQFALAA